jgi:ABC-type dipeptide/oligopeptide/nickel transport system permease subunit
MRRHPVADEPAGRAPGRSQAGPHPPGGASDVLGGRGVVMPPGFLRRAFRHRSFALGGVLTLLLLFAALPSLVWTPRLPYEIDIPSKLRRSSAAHWLGTDTLGRDVASLLLVGVIAVGIGLLVGTAFGLLVSAKRGWVEELIMPVVDFGFAFPAIFARITRASVLIVQGTIRFAIASPSSPRRRRPIWVWARSRRSRRGAGC